MIRRVTISHHTGHPEKPPHFDFFLENGESLITFSSERDFFSSGSLKKEAEGAVARLQDHRLRYLDYEGDISGNRGSVAIVHRGYFAEKELGANKVCGALLMNGIMYSIDFSEHGGAWHMICKPPLREINSGKCKCLFLDLDGTLADTIPDIADALNATLEEFGLAKRAMQDIVANVGWGASKLVDAFVPVEMREKVLARFIELYTQNAARKTSLYPGVKETLGKMESYKVILTNKPEGVTVKVLDSLGILDSFDAVVSPETYGVRKPDARSILIPLEYFGIPPASALFVGDSDVDFETSLNARTRFCSALYGYGPFARRNEYNVVINRFEDILEVL